MTSINKKRQQANQGRRTILKGAGAIGAGAALSALVASGSAIAADMAHGDHAVAHGRKHAKMSDAIHHCVAAGDDCIAHCLNLIKQGDSTIIDCLSSVEQTRALCQAHGQWTAADSPYLNDICRLAIKICGDCSKECDKHAKKHALCKACRDACVTACKAHLQRNKA